MKPFMKNEENPVSKNPEYVLALSSQTFEYVIFDKDLDVFVLFLGGRSC